MGNFSLASCSFVFVFGVQFCMMSTREEQRANIKFLAKSGKMPTQTLAMLS